MKAGFVEKGGIAREWLKEPLEEYKQNNEE